MTGAKSYATVFRAAARGATVSYEEYVILPNGLIGITAGSAPTGDIGHHNAIAIAGALFAIAEVFQNIADAEEQSHDRL